MTGITQPNVYPDQFSGGEGRSLYRSPLMRGRGPAPTGIGQGLENIAAALMPPNPATQALAEDRMAQAELRKAQLATATAKLTESQRTATEARDPIKSNSMAMYGDTLGPLVESFVKNGGVAPSAPETADQPGLMGGYAMDRPAGFTPERERELRGVVTSGRLPGKTTFEQLQKGLLEQQTGGYRGAIAGEPTEGMDPAKVAAGFYATSGKAPFTEGTHGDTFSPLTGKDDASGALPQSYITTQRATAANQGSQAVKHSAETKKITSETLPQVQMPLPNADPNAPPQTVPVLGKDVSKVAAAGASPTLTPEGLDLAVSRFRVDGSLPPNLGRGLQGAKQTLAIINAAGAAAAAEGQTGEAERLRQINTKAAQKALANTINISAGIERSGAILDRHFDVLMGLAKQFDPGRIQILNKAILAGESQFNDPLANTYAAQMQQVMLEYGKLKAGPNSAAMLPVEAMKLGAKVLSAGLDVPSLEGIHGVVKQDIAINKQEANATAEGLRRSMGTKPTQAPKVGASPQRGGTPTFASEADAEAANLPSGTKIVIGGRPATVQ